MARITIEDCLERVSNRFELVLMATRRAHQLEHGAEPAIDADGDKPAVVALREIASNAIDIKTIDAIDEAQRERDAREAIEWAAAEMRDDDERADEADAPTHAPTKPPVASPDMVPASAP